MTKNVKLLNLIADWVSDAIYADDPTDSNAIDLMQGAISDLGSEKDIKQTVALRYALVTFRDCHFTLQKINLLNSTDDFRSDNPESHNRTKQLTEAHQHALNLTRYHLQIQLKHFQQYIKK